MLLFEKKHTYQVRLDAITVQVIDSFSTDIFNNN